MDKKLDILTYYLERSKDSNYLNEYRSTSDKKSGKTFKHINVNFRYLQSFVTNYPKFVEYENKDRKSWDEYKNKEKKAKQYTVRMQQSKIFCLKNGIYKRTAKGYAFGDFVDIINDPKANVSKIDEWLVIYLFILNGYFGFIPNYITERTKEVFELFENNNYKLPYVLDCFKEILSIKEPSKSDLFKCDGFWILTFLKDSDFLQLFIDSSDSEKDSLKNYVVRMSNGSKEKIKERNDLIGWKFVSSGQYDAKMFVEDVRTLYLTYNLLQRNNYDLNAFIFNSCDILSEFYDIDVQRIQDFVKSHSDVFEIIYQEAILDKNIDDELNEDDDLPLSFDEEEPELNKIDDTTSHSTKQLRKTSQILKRIAKSRANYKCELESSNDCRYFTSRKSGNNYLEIHHLIPFEFSNEFEASLEIIENYVALCPNCHRLVHFGADRERKSAITFLYNARIESLKKKGIDISLKQLLAYYHVKNN